MWDDPNENFKESYYYYAGIKKKELTGNEIEDLRDRYDQLDGTDKTNNKMYVLCGQEVFYPFVYIRELHPLMAVYNVAFSIILFVDSDSYYLKSISVFCGVAPVFIIVLHYIRILFNWPNGYEKTKSIYYKNLFYGGCSNLTGFVPGFHFFYLAMTIPPLVGYIVVGVENGFGIGIVAGMIFAGLIYVLYPSLIIIGFIRYVFGSLFLRAV